ncbi:MAG: CopD family protein [Pseudomonadota bacterium]
MLFLVLFGSELGASRLRILSTGLIAAVAGLIILPGQFALEAGRMAGSLSGVMDLELQRFALSTASATVLMARMIALLMLVVAMVRGGKWLQSVGISGVVLIAISFALIGHTAASTIRWLLGPLIVVHVLIVCFWFGELRPLIQVVSVEPSLIGARVVERFSRIAVVLVPMILVAGVVIAALLLPSVNSLRSAYGMGLIAKLLAFALLMGLAALNKWRLGPALAVGDNLARRRFSVAVAAEWGLIALVLVGTAALTTFTSPE